MNRVIDEEEEKTLNEMCKRMRNIETKLNIVLFIIIVEIMFTLWFLFWLK